MSQPAYSLSSDLRVLVIDDDTIAGIVIGKALKSLGVAQIATARNGVQALAQIDADEQPPDVILVDLRMPEMGGMEFLERLADRKFRAPIVLTSGVDAETAQTVADMARGMQLNVLGHCSKPVKAKDLEALLAPVGSAAPGAP